MPKPIRRPYRDEVDPAGTASAEIAAHEAEADPHPGYLTPAEGDAAYSAIGHGHTASAISDFSTAADARVAAGITAHEAASDPHPGYLTPAEGDAAYAAASHTHAAGDIISGTIATALLGSGTADGTTFLRGDQTWATPPGGGVSDGDKGDITVSGSGATWTIDNGAVSLAKMADMATASLIYRKTGGSGAPEVNTLATLKTDLGLTGTNSGDQTITLTGDVTGSGTGSFAATIANDAVTNTKLANVATATIKGRTTAGTGDPEDLSASQARTVMGLATSDSPQFTGIELGHATDTTITRSAAGVLAVEGGVIPKENRANAFTTTNTFAASSSGGVITATQSGAGQAAVLRKDAAGAAAIALALGNNATLAAGQEVTLDLNPTTQAVGVRSVQIAAISPAGTNNTDFVVRTSAANPPAERMRIRNNGAVSFGTSGTAWGTSGQVLTSQGDSASPQWVTPSGGVSDGDKGDITVSGSGATWTIDNGVVTNAKMADVATATFKGRATAGTGAPEDMTATQATAQLSTFTDALKGLAPASGGGTANYLRADGAWAAPPSGGSITNASDALTGNVTLTANNTFYDGPSVSLAAGTWLVIFHANYTRAATGVSQVTARITNNTNHYASQNSYHASVSGITLSFAMSAIITLGSTTTIKGQMATSSGNANALMRAQVNNNASGNTATIINAIRLA